MQKQENDTGSCYDNTKVIAQVDTYGDNVAARKLNLIFRLELWLPLSNDFWKKFF